MQQIVNNLPTTYTLDLAAPLVQVLIQQDANGETAYLYGVTRVGEQQPDGWAYHLSDARPCPTLHRSVGGPLGVGSVRQLVDVDGQVTLARGYTPYGEPLWAQGSGQSAYGFTGEDFDVSTGLVFLRARYMQPGLGMFLSRDPWSGDVLRPGSMNGWNYVEDDPINSYDPTGRCRDNPRRDGLPGDPCIDEANRLSRVYHVRIELGIPRLCSSIFDAYDFIFRGIAISWTTGELGRVEDALQLTQSFLDSTQHSYIGAIGDRGYSIKRVHHPSVTSEMVTRQVGNKVWTEINDTVFGSGVIEADWPWQIHLFMHEIFHGYDFLNGNPSTNGFPASPDRDSQGRCIPSSAEWACRGPKENFVESVVSYATEWLARHGLGDAQTKAYRLVEELSPPIENPPVQLVGNWGDNHARQQWLDGHFLGQDLIWPTTRP